MPISRSLRRLFVHNPPDPVQFWSARAEEEGWNSVMWRNAAYNELAHRDQWSMIERFLPEQRNSVLDLGCGTGRLSQALREHFPNYVGVDLQPMVAEARLRNPQLDGQYVAASIFDYDYPPDSFDLVLSMACLGNACPSERLGELAQKMARSTRVGGRVVMLDAFHWTPLLARVCRIAPRDVIRIFEGAGLTLKYWGGLHFVPVRLILARRQFVKFRGLVQASYRIGEWALRIAPRTFCDYSVIVLEKTARGTHSN